MVETAAQARKEAAIEFLQLIVSGRIDEAYDKHVDMNGRHHNPFFLAGFRALQKGMAENHEEFPAKELLVKHVLGDGDLVAVHSHLVPRAGDTGMIVMHLFRFHADKIVEFWDCGQRIPADSPNNDGAF